MLYSAISCYIMLYSVLIALHNITSKNVNQYFITIRPKDSIPDREYNEERRTFEGKLPRLNQIYRRKFNPLLFGSGWLRPGRRSRPGGLARAGRGPASGPGRPDAATQKRVELQRINLIYPRKFTLCSFTSSVYPLYSLPI